MTECVGLYRGLKFNIPAAAGSSVGILMNYLVGCSLVGILLSYVVGCSSVGILLSYLVGCSSVSTLLSYLIVYKASRYTPEMVHCQKGKRGADFFA